MAINAKKTLGQNWLNSPKTLKAIIEAADLKAGEMILEVGPGKGALTEKLLLSGAEIVAVEKDDRLIEMLQKKFSAEVETKKINFIADDILKLDAEKLGFENRKYKIVANLPYYITGQFLRKWLEQKIKPTQMVLMLQKEVAERIVAHDGRESILSLATKFFGKPEIITRVPRAAFQPMPKVDSAIISITNISNENEKTICAENFFKILHRGFAHPRKNLKNNLDEESWRLAACKISPTERPAKLKLDHWLCLASAQK